MSYFTLLHLKQLLTNFLQLFTKIEGMFLFDYHRVLLALRAAGRGARAEQQRRASELGVDFIRDMLPLLIIAQNRFLR